MDHYLLQRVDVLLSHLSFNYPSLLIYIIIKYIVAVQNLSCYYTATEDQPELVTTAAKLSIVASIFPQVNFTLLMIIKQGMKENEDHFVITIMTTFLL